MINLEEILSFHRGGKYKCGGDHLARVHAHIAMRGDVILEELYFGKSVAALRAHVLLLLFRIVGFHMQRQVLLPVELLPAFLNGEARACEFTVTMSGELLIVLIKKLREDFLLLSSPSLSPPLP
jgi:hypothetical protein